MFSWSKLTQAASTKVANFKVIGSDSDHADNEDESAVSRALRTYYKEKDGFVPDWLAPAAVSPMAPNNPQIPLPHRQTAPPQMATGGSPAMLGDIFGDGPAKAPQALPMRSGMQSAPPVQHQQHQPPPPPQPQQAQQAPPPQRQGLPGGPRGGVKPFMALKREQQQRQQAQPPPPQQPQPQPQQPAPPAAAPRQQSYGPGPTQPSGGRVPPPPAGYGSPAGGRRGFAAAAGETGGRSSAPPPQASGRAPPANDKPFMSATAPWSGGGDDFGGYGGSPGYYGR